MDSSLNEHEQFFMDLTEVFDIYINCGSRSSKKVDLLHNRIKNMINNVINKTNNKEIYKCELECNIPCCNASGKKKCDIVIFKNNVPYIIFPVKFIMTNYKQNKNNAWENVTGELTQIRWANKEIHIIPINIIFNQVPYLKTDKKIERFETITYENSFKIYEYLKSEKIVFDQMNYIIDVNQKCEIYDFYDKCPELLAFNSETPYRTMYEIIHTLIT